MGTETKLDVTGLNEKEFKQDETVLEEGKTGSIVYILKEGSLRVEAGGNELVKFNTPGTVLGEIAALLKVEHTATVTTEEDSVFYVIDDFEAYFKDNSSAALDIARILATRVMHMNQHFVEVRHEIEELRKDPTTQQETHGRLHNLLSKMDSFWGQEIFGSAEPATSG
jgi:CRP-like cAMP-binding protein